MEKIYDEKYKSECHNSKVYVVSSGEGTNHYECDLCLKPCNPIVIEEERKENIVIEPTPKKVEEVPVLFTEEKNGEENGDKRGVPNSKPTQFNSENQPPVEAKKLGWDRRRVAQNFMDLVIQFQNMPAEEFEALTKDMQVNKKYTVFEMMAHKYATKIFNKDKFLLDFMSRHVSKAPRDINLETKQPVTKVVVEVVKGNNDTVSVRENSEN